MSCHVCRKFNLSEDQFKNMVKSGVISVTYLHYDQIYDTFKRHYSVTGSHGQAVMMTADECNVERTTVYRVLEKLK